MDDMADFFFHLPLEGSRQIHNTPSAAAAAL